MKCIHTVSIFIPVMHADSLVPRLSLALMKYKNRGEEPVINLHMISQHDNVSAIIANVVMQLCFSIY